MATEFFSRNFRNVLHIEDIFKCYLMAMTKFNDIDAVRNVGALSLDAGLSSHNIWKQGLVSHQGGSKYIIGGEVDDQ